MDTYAFIQKSNHYCAYALVLYCLALIALTIGVFVPGPTSIPGLLALGIGVLLMFGCISCFALFSSYVKKAERSIQ
jgi:ABC-type transport system involved in multi-copper enzyme maturation permease subunit